MLLLTEFGISFANQLQTYRTYGVDGVPAMTSFQTYRLDEGSPPLSNVIETELRCFRFSTQTQVDHKGGYPPLQAALGPSMSSV